MKVLFLFEHSPLAETLRGLNSSDNFSVTIASEISEAMACLELEHFSLVLIDMDEAELPSLQFLEWLSTRQLADYVVLLSAKTHRDEFVRAMSLGVHAVSSSVPMDHSLWERRLQTWLNSAKCLKERSAVKGLTEVHDDLRSLSPQVRSVFERVGTLGCASSPLLFRGETGVGKRFLMNLLVERFSVCKTFILDAERTTDFDQNKFLSEVFQKILLSKQEKEIQLSSLCLLIHEIGFLSSKLQDDLAEILRDQTLLSEGQFYPLEMTVLASSTRDLETLVEEGSFREDLYLYFKFHQLELPSLRERPEDISLLARHFLNKASDHSKYLTVDAEESLRHYSWPKNISELKDLMNTMATSVEGAQVTAFDLPAEILASSFYVEGAGEDSLMELSYLDAKKRVLNKFHTAYIADLLRKSDNNLTVAAEKAGMDRSNFKKVIRKYGFL